jgi:hypothetical protein
MDKTIISETGITVKQLKQWLDTIPDITHDNHEAMIIVDGTDCPPGITNGCIGIIHLENGDILIQTKL